MPDKQNNNESKKFNAFNQVIRNPTISPAAKGLYALLWSYADGNGTCWPGIKVLAEQMGCDTRTIRRLLTKLVDAGAITKKRRGKTLTNMYCLSDGTELSYHKEESDRTKLSGVIGQNCHSDRTNLSLENASPPYSHAASGEPIIPIKRPIENTNFNFKATNVAEGKKKSSKSKSDKTTTDERVQPVLKHFYEKFKEHVGVEPTKQAFDWGRDGKRIKELPQSYTEELLTECIFKFFAAPGYIKRNCRFGDFLNALPRLLTGDYDEGGKNHGAKWIPAPEPSKSWDDWRT
ncbi:MAG: helix-turn-helix domain-containing protein [Thermoanaerobacter sp.]|nr:helix-turn-helix domain-containing protein [Thermoanaerobacter sp.]